MGAWSGVTCAGMGSSHLAPRQEGGEGSGVVELVAGPTVSSGPLHRAGGSVGPAELLPGAQGLGRHPGQVLGAAGELECPASVAGARLGAGDEQPPWVERGGALVEAGDPWCSSASSQPLPLGVSSISSEDLALDLGLARAIRMTSSREP